MLTLYFAPGSSSMAPHIALHEIGAPFESRPISLAKGETRTPAYLALNPEGKVPTLLIDGRPLTEVAAILFYLARRFSAAGLLPEGDLEAEARAHLVDVVHRRDRASSATPGDRACPRRVRHRGSAIGESRVGAGRYSIADIHYPPVPPVLAVPQLAPTGARRVSQPLRPLRPHDGAARGATNVRDRSSDRLRAGCVAGRPRGISGPLNRDQETAPTGRASATRASPPLA